VTVAANRKVLIVTGAAAAGKSTVCIALAADPRLLALDGDVLARGAAAVADGARDYEAFWRYLLCIAAEVHRNAVVPVFAGICLPSQVVVGRGPDVDVHFLALVSNDATVRRRIAFREGPNGSIDQDFHAAFDAQLRDSAVPPPHTFTLLDTTELTPAQTVAASEEWVRTLS
jgi:hypothetical protein